MAVPSSRWTCLATRHARNASGRGEGTATYEVLRTTGQTHPMGPEGQRRYWSGAEWTSYTDSPDRPYGGSAPPSLSPDLQSSESVARKPWFKRPIPLIVAGFVVLLFVAGVVGGGSQESSSGGDSPG